MFVTVPCNVVILHVECDSWICYSRASKKVNALEELCFVLTFCKNLLPEC